VFYLTSYVPLTYHVAFGTVWVPQGIYAPIASIPAVSQLFSWHRTVQFSSTHLYCHPPRSRFLFSLSLPFRIVLASPEGRQPFEFEEPKDPVLHYFTVFKEPLQFFFILYLCLRIELTSHTLTSKEPLDALNARVAVTWAS
jgi:hypothetical protein